MTPPNLKSLNDIVDSLEPVILDVLFETDVTGVYLQDYEKLKTQLINTYTLLVQMIKDKDYASRIH